MGKQAQNDLVDRLIEDGQHVLSTKFDAGDPNCVYSEGRPFGVDLQSFAKWAAGCANLVRLLGPLGDTWAADLVGKQNEYSSAVRMLGTLEAIKDAIDHGLLVRIEDLVLADAFDNLLEQAEYLLTENYFLAAGVLGRAVLEEHLRAWCDAAGCAPTTQRPTLNNYKDALYRAKHFNTSVMKHVEAMAAVGNDAAHNKPSLTKDEVERLLRDVRDFLAKHSYAG